MMGTSVEAHNGRQEGGGESERTWVKVEVHPSRTVSEHDKI